MYVARNKNGKLVISNKELYLPSDIIPKTDNNSPNDEEYYPLSVINEHRNEFDLYYLYIDNVNCNIKFEDGCKEIKEIII